MRDLKYLAAFSIPLVALLGIYLKGFWVFATPIYAFILLPVLELIFPIDEHNLDKNEVDTKLKNKLFDWLLYLNLPIVYGILLLGLLRVTTTEIQPFEFIGLFVSTGIVLGVNGINVGHELGHRQSTNERFLVKLYCFPPYTCIFI